MSPAPARSALVASRSGTHPRRPRRRARRRAPTPRGARGARARDDAVLCAVREGRARVDEEASRERGPSPAIADERARAAGRARSSALARRANRNASCARWNRRASSRAGQCTRGAARARWNRRAGGGRGGGSEARASATLRDANEDRATTPNDAGTSRPGAPASSARRARERLAQRGRQRRHRVEPATHERPGRSPEAPAARNCGCGFPARKGEREGRRCRTERAMTTASRGPHNLLASTRVGKQSRCRTKGSQRPKFHPRRVPSASRKRRHALSREPPPPNARTGTSALPSNDGQRNAEGHLRRQGRPRAGASRRSPSRFRASAGPRRKASPPGSRFFPGPMPSPKRRGANPRVATGRRRSRPRARTPAPRLHDHSPSVPRALAPAVASRAPARSPVPAPPALAP